MPSMEKIFVWGPKIIRGDPYEKGRFWGLGPPWEFAGDGPALERWGSRDGRPTLFGTVSYVYSVCFLSFIVPNCALRLLNCFPYHRTFLVVFY